MGSRIGAVSGVGSPCRSKHHDSPVRMLEESAVCRSKTYGEPGVSFGLFPRFQPTSLGPWECRDECRHLREKPKLRPLFGIHDQHRGKRQLETRYTHVTEIALLEPEANEVQRRYRHFARIFHGDFKVSRGHRSVVV